MSLVYSLYIDCQFMLNCKSPFVCLSCHLMLCVCAFHLFTKLSVCLFLLLICLSTQHIMHINSSVTCGRISVVKPKHLTSYSNDDVTAQVQLDYLAYMEEQSIWKTKIYHSQNLLIITKPDVLNKGYLNYYSKT